MEKQMKLFTNMTKPFVLFVLLFALGVGNVWGGDNQCDFYGTPYIKLWVNSSKTVQMDLAHTGVSDLELGVVDALYLSELCSQTWKYNDGNVCSVKFCYGINSSRGSSYGSTYEIGHDDYYADWWGKEGADKDKCIQQWKRQPDGWNLLDGLTPGQDYYLDFYLHIYGNKGGSSDCYDNQKYRNNNGGNYHVHFRVADSKSTFTAGTYFYFDARELTSWQANNPDMHFFFKEYYYGNTDIGDVKGLKANALENWVYYVTVPSGNDRNGTVEIARVRPEGGAGDYYWNKTNYMYACDRDNASQNCLIGSGDDKWNSWSPTWGTYCPPMSDVDLEEDGTTLDWGGNGSSGTPYLIPTGASIKVKATNATKAVDDDNMTIYYQFKKAGTEVQAGSTTASATITASGSTGTKEAVTVEAYNYYNSTSGTHLASNEIYYEVRTPYTISYNKGSNGTGSKDSETKLHDISFTLPNSAIFTRIGYTQTSWSTADGSGTNYNLGGSYTTNSAQTFYPVWTANQRVITLNGNGGSGNSENVTLTYDSNTHAAITAPTRSGYTFLGWYSGGDGSGNVSGSLIIDRSGVLQANVDDYTGADGIWKKDATTTLYAKWSLAYTITLDDEDAGTENQTVTATIGESFLIGSITYPTKYGYRFDAWKLSSGTELISNTGTLKSNVTDYTDADGKWIYTNNVTLTPVWSKVWCIRGEKQTGSGNVDGEIGGWVINTNILNPDGTTGTFEIELSASSTYELAVVDMTGSDKWYKGTTSGYAITSSSTSLASLTESTGDAAERNITLTTTNAGAYRFTFNFSTKAFTVTYPQYQVNFSEGDVDGSNSDPNAWSYNLNHAATNGNYYQSGDKIIIYSQDPKSGYKWKEWNTSSNGSGSQIKPYRNDTIESLSGTVTAYAIYEPKTYNLPLVGMEATTHTQTSVSVTYNASTNMTASDGVTKPTKNNYTFGGYWVRNESTFALETQLIDADGKWIADKTGYTSHDGEGNPTWVHDYAISLYAKWTETLHTVEVAVLPEGSGSVKVGGEAVTSVTGVGYSTHSAVMTADSVNALWTFKEWQATSDAHLQTGSYSVYRPTMDITAEADDQTVTAVFQHRYNLLGSKFEEGAKADMATGGMPGWSYGNGEDFTINTYPGDGDDVTVELVYTCNLDEGTYIFEIHDRATGKSLGRKNGTAIYQLAEGESVELRDGTDQNESVFFYPQAEGEYTFKITHMRKSGVNYYPTVTILRPQQVNFGRRYVNIGGSLTDGDAGGTVAVTKDSDGSNVSNGTWLPYGTAVTYTAAPTSGYRVDWYNTSDYETGYITSSYTIKHAGKTTGNGYVKFTELATSVSLENDGHGKIQIGGVDTINTTCGVSTERELTAVPNTGYSFREWSKPSGEDIKLTSYSTNPTTLSALGNGLNEGQRIYASFTAKTYSVKLNNDHEGASSEDGSATATYDATSLSVSDHADFTGWTLLGYWNSSAKQVTDESGNLIANVDGYTDADGKWTNDAGETVNLWAHWSRSVTLDDNGGSADGSVTVTYKGTAGTPSAPKKTGYHVEGYYADEDCTHKVMAADGTLVNYTGYVADGKWTKTDATTLYAKWEPNTYTVTLHNDHEGASSDDGTATATYDATSLSSITDAQFSGWTLLGYWNSSAVQVADAEGNLKASVTGFTDGSGKWTKTDDAEVWAHWSRTITLNDNVAQRHNGSVSVTYKGSTASHSAPASRAGYDLAGYYDDASGTTKVMNADGTLVTSVSGYTDGSGNWIHKTAATLYTKWTSDHFIIYRTGDKSDDPRKLGTDVESYVGGDLDKAIEFRMKVRELDKWYTLCLPFTVSAVKVWDEAYCEYYDLVPYYRTDVGATLQGGHYIIRTPNTATNLAITEFGDWRDPTSADGYLPSKNTPYIIQWHMSYFDGMYISFFGATGQTIPESMSVGDAPSLDNVVNVYGNNSMQSGSVAGAYLLENDYGSNGAWLRLENTSTARTILPFECYILANSATTTKYRVLRRDMTITDTPTGWEDVLNSERKAQIMVYTISGFRVAQFDDCSYTEAATRLRTEHGEGIYILRADNESVKLMVGGK